MIYSALHKIGTTNMFHRHEDNANVDNRCQFYSTTVQAAIVETVAKKDPSVVKSYNSVSLEGTHQWGVTFTSSSGQATGVMTWLRSRSGLSLVSMAT